MYENTIARVMTDDGLTEAFLILAGVMQGDTLAPYLFIIVIDYIMTTTLHGKDMFGKMVCVEEIFKTVYSAFA